MRRPGVPTGAASRAMPYPVPATGPLVPHAPARTPATASRNSRPVTTRGPAIRSRHE
ncbi:hypothetical protein ACFPM0_25005 [Pseudonocardia sulfidoxydans]|uniref:hypothetical protein n=1 Tax=Pseudonocardia sulfidoxydans TaxID=54011 RepID=UPI003613DC57